MKRRRTHIEPQPGDATLVEIILVLLVSTLLAIIAASVIWAMVQSVMP